MKELWVAIVATDRPSSLAALCGDLVAAAGDSGHRVRLIVTDNSRSDEASAEISRILSDLPLSVNLERTRGGESIAASRTFLRDQIARLLTTHGRPRFIWMLDDDVRLKHVCWNGTHVEIRELHRHLDFLCGLGEQHPNMVALIGEVTGDPPIPAVATLASRLTDLVGNCRRLADAAPDTLWQPRETSVQALDRLDVYYDLSLGVAPAWQTTVDWLPRSSKPNLEAVTRELVSAAESIPFGAGLTRPILARPERFAKLETGTQRGANAVFFLPEACLDHPYPAINFGSFTTRRSDMIGSAILSAKYPNRVFQSSFSVAHVRESIGPIPKREELVRALVSDSLGAYFAREVKAALGGASAVGFLEQRLARLNDAAIQVWRAKEALAALGKSPTTPPTLAAAVDSLSKWVESEYPGNVRGIASEVSAALEHTQAHQVIQMNVNKLVEGR